MGNLQRNGHTDLPFATQRSDDWPMESVPEDYTAYIKDDPRKVKRFAQRDLRLDDMQRRLKDAQNLIDTEMESYEKERTSAEAEKSKERARFEESQAKP